MEAKLEPDYLSSWVHNLPHPRWATAERAAEPSHWVSIRHRRCWWRHDSPGLLQLRDDHRPLLWLMGGRCQGQRGYKLTNQRRLRGSEFWARVGKGEDLGLVCLGRHDGEAAAKCPAWQTKPWTSQSDSLLNLQHNRAAPHTASFGKHLNANQLYEGRGMAGANAEPGPTRDCNDSEKKKEVYRLR